MAKAKIAAAAIGLSVGELADLMVDNGLTALPKTDGVTKRYTMEELGRHLWSEMQSGQRSERATWFAGLSEPQQNAIICVLRHHGFSCEAISNDFKIGITTVARIWSAYAADLGSQVVGIRLDTIAGQLQIVSERAQQMAQEAGDAATYWRIQKEMVACLQSLGIVERAIHRVEVTHRLGDDQKAEIERMLELESKKLIRREEIRKLTVTVEKPEPLPAEVATRDYDDEEDTDE